MNKLELQRFVTSTALGMSILLSAALLYVPQAHADTETLSRQDAIHLDDRAWINTIGTLLYTDPDNDSFFSGVSISIDADSSYFSYAVYAAIDIIDQSGRTDRLHSTQTFDVYDNSSADEYHVDIDLLRNFTPAIYDLRITLFDAYNNQLLDRVSAQDFQNLNNLPLESEDYIDIFIPVEDRPERPVNDSVFAVEYAASSGKGFVLLLLISLVVRAANIRTRRKPKRAARSF